MPSSYNTRLSHHNTRLALCYSSSWKLSTCLISMSCFTSQHSSWKNHTRPTLRHNHPVESRILDWLLRHSYPAGSSVLVSSHHLALRLTAQSEARNTSHLALRLTTRSEARYTSHLALRLTARSEARNTSHLALRLTARSEARNITSTPPFEGGPFGQCQAYL
jgi:hypothetical protein